MPQLLPTVPDRLDDEPDDPPTHRRLATRLRAAAWAALFAAPLALGLVARVDGARASWLGLEGPACRIASALSPAWCPGCGLTRGTALLTQGRVSEALALAPAALPLALACLVGLAAQLVVLARGRRGDGHLRLRQAGGRALAAALVLCWLMRLIPG